MSINVKYKEELSKESFEECACTCSLCKVNKPKPICDCTRVIWLLTRFEVSLDNNDYQEHIVKVEAFNNENDALEAYPSNCKTDPDKFEESHRVYNVAPAILHEYNCKYNREKPEYITALNNMLPIDFE